MLGNKIRLGARRVCLYVGVEPVDVSLLTEGKAALKKMLAARPHSS